MCGWCAFVPNTQPGCVLDPSSLGELSLLSETEAIVAYKVIVKAFGGGSLLLQDFGPASGRVIFMGAEGRYHLFLPVWILFLGDGP